VNLPTRTETRVHCPLSLMQTFWYKRLLLRDSSLLLKLESEAAAGSSEAEAAHSLAAEVWPPPRPCHLEPVMKALENFTYDELMMNVG